MCCGGMCCGGMEEYAYSGPEIEPDPRLPPLHTSLTTTAAVKAYRDINKHHITCYIKAR